ncbi:hypothetical protein INT43_009124 [Umbelopsis isabellina]|uniref:YncI copper-binding domain-containing protein n=1 Tax=Mortierella isabellina TaxID=91625 RepID=A0A8H7PCN3_MORIS|nr:hypothetical protein INT43_009124 [Umbelopsis isabellina]
MKSFIAICLFSLAALSSAHVTFTVYSGQPGSYLSTALRVPHGCNGSATNAISLSIPDNVYSIKPQVVANWNLTIQYRDLTTPVTIEGQQINQTVSNITWDNGLLPNDEFQEFGLQIALPDSGYNGTDKLWFPVLQTCVNGSTFWGGIANTSSWDQYTGHPAPTIELTNASASTSSGQATASGVQSSATSVSTSMVWTMLFLVISSFVLLA